MDLNYHQWLEKFLEKWQWEKNLLIIYHLVELIDSFLDPRYNLLSTCVPSLKIISIVLVRYHVSRKIYYKTTNIQLCIYIVCHTTKIKGSCKTVLSNYILFEQN